MKSKKHHIPVVDATPDLPPPKFVAIVGGPKVGKTTLMKAIIKNYVPKKISDIKVIYYAIKLTVINNKTVCIILIKKKKQNLSIENMKM